MGACEYNVVYSITSEYVNSENIVVTDNQTINECSEPYSKIYNSEKSIANTFNKDVVYTFKLNKNGNYYLDKVDVK